MCPLNSHSVTAFYGHLHVYLHLSLEILSNCKFPRGYRKWGGGRKEKKKKNVPDAPASFIFFSAQSGRLLYLVVLLVGSNIGFGLPSVTNDITSY